jgi:hypothetical protein
MKNLKVIIAGSRDFNDYIKLKNILDKFNLLIKNKGYEITQIISGTCKGADLLGERYAKENNIDIVRFPAKWDTYGKKAGYLRNLEMGEYGDILIAFPVGESKGTYNMVDIMKKLNKKYFIIK